MFYLLLSLSCVDQVEEIVSRYNEDRHLVRLYSELICRQFNNDTEKSKQYVLKQVRKHKAVRLKEML